MTRQIVGFFIILLILSVTVTSCFTTNIITLEKWDEREINLDFERLNTRKTYNLFLEKKDIILVDMSKDKGTLNLHVYDENNRKIYSGNGNLANNFVLGIPEEGIYKIELEGNNARGSLKIEVK